VSTLRTRSKNIVSVNGTSKTLEGRTALVTAAGQGIGRAIAEAFIDAGACVVASDLRPESLNGMACRKEFLDVRDRPAIEALMESITGLDVLVNCAGYVHEGTILETSDDAWTTSFELNARSMFWTMHTAVRHMERVGGGAIINIGSVVSSLKAAPRRFVYSASKAAVIGMTKSVALDFIGKGIRVNAICPGTVDSPSLRGRIAQSGDAASALEAMIKRQPMGRLGKPAEIAQMAVYLASGAGAFATGACFVLDGGMSL
jgi:2-keto-3-deoxy-L-fuconate dehydrogenase